MKVYLDDVRPTPADWTHCYWPDEVIALLQTNKVTHLSLDHDLGDDRRGTGYDVLLWIEEAVVGGDYHPPVITVHSANAAAVKRMEHAIEVIGVRHDAIHNQQPDKYEKGD